MNSMPVLSIIVAYHSSTAYLKACLESILDTAESRHEIIVVINNSAKEVHEVNFFDDRVKYLHYYENLGHARAVNLGVQHASHSHVVISDHDLVFQEKWLENLWASYIKEDSIRAVSCKILNTTNGRILDYGIAYSDFNLGHPNMDLPIHHSLVSDDNVAQMICTGGLLISKSDFLKIGPFEETFGSLYTDLDLCLKLKRKGFQVAAASNAHAYHFGGEFSLINRDYKNGQLKGDVKGTFMRNNSDVLVSDMELYYERSVEYFKKEYGSFEKYFCCNMMNVVNPWWYEEVMERNGMEFYDRYVKPSKVRDAYLIGLFELLGFDLMQLGVPIAYFVDRFVCIEGNHFWWKHRRNGQKDIVVDRNGNVLPVKEVLSMT